MSRNSRISLGVLVLLLIAGAYSIFTGNRGPAPGTAVAAGAGTGMVLLDANGQEVGPVIDLQVTDEAGHAESDMVIALVAITLPDSTGTPRTFLQRVTHEGYIDHYTEGFGIRFAGDYCGGEAYMHRDDRAFLGFPDLYVPSMTLTLPAKRAQVVFAAVTDRAERVDVISVLESHECSPAGFAEDNLYKAEILSLDLNKAFPPPFTIRGR